MDDVTEEPQTPEQDRVGDKRLSRAKADFLVGDTSSEWDSYRMCVEGTTDRTRLIGA